MINRLGETDGLCLLYPEHAHCSPCFLTVKNSPFMDQQSSLLASCWLPRNLNTTPIFPSVVCGLQRCDSPTAAGSYVHGHTRQHQMPALVKRIPRLDDPQAARKARPLSLSLALPSEMLHTHYPIMRMIMANGNRVRDG